MVPVDFFLNIVSLVLVHLEVVDLNVVLVGVNTVVLGLADALEHLQECLHLDTLIRNLRLQPWLHDSENVHQSSSKWRDLQIAFDVPFVFGVQELDFGLREDHDDIVGHSILNVTVFKDVDESSLDK